MPRKLVVNSSRESRMTYCTRLTSEMLETSKADSRQEWDSVRDFPEGNTWKDG